MINLFVARTEAELRWGARFVQARDSSSCGSRGSEGRRGTLGPVSTALTITGVFQNNNSEASLSPESTGGSVSIL